MGGEKVYFAVRINGPEIDTIAAVMLAVVGKGELFAQRSGADSCPFPEQGNQFVLGNIVAKEHFAAKGAVLGFLVLQLTFHAGLHMIDVLRTNHGLEPGCNQLVDRAVRAQAEHRAHTAKRQRAVGMFRNDLSVVHIQPFHAGSADITPAGVCEENPVILIFQSMGDAARQPVRPCNQNPVGF